MMHRIALLVAGCSLAGSAFAADLDLSKLPPASTRAGVTFEKDILPIFQDSCVRCHGAEKPKVGLRLDSAEAVLKGSKNGKVIVPGDSAKSDLVIAVARLDSETAMPPLRQRPQAGPPAKPLTPEQVGLIRAWIDQGAK